LGLYYYGPLYGAFLAKIIFSVCPVLPDVLEVNQNITDKLNRIKDQIYFPNIDPVHSYMLQYVPLLSHAAKKFTNLF